MASDALNNGAIHLDDLKKLLLGLGIPGLTDKIAVEQVHTHTHPHPHPPTHTHTHSLTSRWVESLQRLKLLVYAASSY
jgi:hypothetical protein